MNTAAPPATDPLAQLNPAQREAVLHGSESPTTAGPLLIIAGAGTGKTNTLAHRVAHLVQAGASPESILLLTFSRRAADEMIRRVRRLISRTSSGGALASELAIPWAGTFHAVGARLLREHAHRVGLDPAFTLHDRADSADLMNLVRHELGFSSQEKRFPLKGTCLAIYSSVVNARAPLAQVLLDSYPWCANWQAELKQLFRAYVETKQGQQVLDYDDLLLYWAQMMAEPEIAHELAARFRHVLVDEYQDTNALQAGILLALKPDGRGLTVVGDDAQSIYAFRGATVRNILDFPQAFDPPAHRVTLEQNYRSTQPILQAANGVIGLAAERFTKDLWTTRGGERAPQIVSVADDAAQAAFVVERTLARREAGMRLKAQAVLFRASHHSARLELELTRRNIPFVKFGGLKFLEAAHIKDVLAILRWGRNQRDRLSGFRAIQLLAGVGPKTAGRMLDHLAQAPAGCALLAELPVPPASRSAWLELASLVENATARAAPWPGTFEAVCRWYESQMERLFEDATARQADIQQLARIAGTYPNLERFLTELTLDPPDATSDEAGAPLRDEDYLILSTIHSAKGQEWAAVSILNAVDGCIPSDLATGSSEEIEEERRLLYVAMTRARDELDLITPQRFYTSQQSGYGDRHVYAARTRFIPARLLPCFEQHAWPPADPDAPAGQRSGTAIADLKAQMRAMWD